MQFPVNDAVSSRLSQSTTHEFDISGTLQGLAIAVLCLAKSGVNPCVNPTSFVKSHQRVQDIMCTARKHGNHIMDYSFQCGETLSAS